MREKISPSVWLLGVTGLVAPIMGGQISTGKAPLEGGLLSEIWSGASVPLLQHALISLPIFAVLAIQLLRHRVLQAPNRIVGFLVAGFIACLVGTVPLSAFKGLSIPLALEWLAYAAAFYATVAAGGRRNGPKLIMGAIFLGCTYVALNGILEYGEKKPTNPTWRIFAGWVEPNATAVILLIGVFMGLGLTLTFKRVERLVCALLTGTMLLSIWLTQSRGTFGVLLIALPLFALAAGVWSSKARSTRYSRMVTGVVLAAIVGASVLAPIAQTLLPINTSAANVSLGPEKVGVDRLTGAGLATDESTLFRKLLWKGSGTLLKQYPTGVGLGSYRYYSAKSGLTTQTIMAHEVYLQLATEATIFAPALLALALLVWAANACKGPEGLPRDQNILRAACVAAVFGVLAHSTVDSDLYYFGIGLCVFMLLGVSMLLSADAVAPEFVPAGMRRAGAVVVCLLVPLFLFCGYVEMLKSRLRFELSARDLPGAQADAGDLLSLASFDGDALELASRATASRSDQKTLSIRAADAAPNTQTLRALARLQMQDGETGPAISTLNRALDLDPNNLTTLTALLDFEKQTNEESAQQTAQRIIAVEQTLYFKIRSLPELVPTETYESRVYLAGLTASPRKKLELLVPALAGFHDYARHTWPNVVENAKGGGAYGEETIPVAQGKIQMGEDVAKEVQRLAAAAGDRAVEAAAVSDEADFLKALASVTK